MWKISKFCQGLPARARANFKISPKKRREKRSTFRQKKVREFQNVATKWPTENATTFRRRDLKQALLVEFILRPNHRRGRYYYYSLVATSGTWNRKYQKCLTHTSVVRPFTFLACSARMSSFLQSTVASASLDLNPHNEDQPGFAPLTACNYYVLCRRGTVHLSLSGFLYKSQRLLQ